jgi:hypothetical protein
MRFVAFDPLAPWEGETFATAGEAADCAALHPGWHVEPVGAGFFSPVQVAPRCASPVQPQLFDGIERCKWGYEI